MSSRFTSGKWAIADCDRCGQRYKLKELKELVIKTKNVNIMVCSECWEEDHPQLQLGMYPVEDPQAVRNPRPDGSLTASRDIQWGWAPVGGGNPYASPLTPNALASVGGVGTVTVVLT